MTPTVHVDDALRDQPDSIENVMPEFTFIATLGRTTLDDLSTDLVVVPKLYRLAIPEKLHVKHPGVGDSLRKKVKAGFQGRRGAFDVLSTDLPNSAGQPGCKILLTGIGAAESYCADVAAQIFEVVFKKALEMGVRKVTIPFVSNRVTGSNVNLGQTACRMKRALAKVLRESDGKSTLREVEIYCTASAVRHIKDGLGAAPDEDCHCQRSACPNSDKAGK